jgi:hypothetical protein
MRVVVMVFVCLLTIQFSRAAEANPCEGEHCINTEILRLYPASDVSDPRVYVLPTDGGQSSLNCTAVSGVYLTLKASHPLFAEIYSALLAATIHDKEVFLNIKPGSPDCEIRYITVENP